MSNLTDLQDAKTNLIANLKAISVNPKPTYNIDGQSVSHDAYRASLLQSIRDINELLAAEGDDNYEPWETSILGDT